MRDRYLHDDEVGGAGVFLQKLIQSDLAIRLHERRVRTVYFIRDVPSALMEEWRHS